MICFEITLNGRRVYTAGVADGLVSFNAVLLRPDTRRSDEPAGIGRWSLSGFTDEQGYRENVTWAGITELSETDVITVRVVRSGRPDPPSTRSAQRMPKPKKITGANAGGPRQLPMRMHWAARFAQFRGSADWPSGHSGRWVRRTLGDFPFSLVNNAKMNK